MVAAAPTSPSASSASSIDASKSLKPEVEGALEMRAAGKLIPSINSRREALVYIAKHTLRRATLTALATLLVRPLYMRIAKNWRYGERSFWVFVTVALHALTYVGVNAPLLLLDHFGCMQRYKLHRNKAQIPSFALIKRTLAEAAVGQLVLGPVQLSYGGYQLFKYFGMPSPTTQLPSFGKLVGQFSICHLFNVIGFYIVHRACHESTFLYKHIHKKHHEYKGTIGIGAEHAHPVEQLFANLLPTIGGSLFFGRHPLVFWMYLTDRLIETYEAHSGFCLAGSWLHRLGLTNAEQAAFHDHHHTSNSGNYAMYAIDYLGGTLVQWKKDGEHAGYLAKKADACK